MGAGANTHDSRNHGWYFLISFIVAVVPWIIAVPIVYSFPKNRLLAGYWYSALATPSNSWLMGALIFGIALGFLLMLYLVNHNRTNFEGAAFHQKLRGSEMVNHAKLASMYKEPEKQLRFIGVPVPKSAEYLHFLFTGSTGSGKTVGISDLIQSSQERGTDRILCVDPNGGFLRHFYKDGDVILNPFDERGTGWSIFNEIRTKFDCEQYAISMIPKSPSTEQESWNSYARVLVSETLIKIREDANIDTDFNGELFYWLINAPVESVVDEESGEIIELGLYDFLKGSPAQGLFHAREMFYSIKGVITQYVKPHKYLKSGDFSIRDYLENGKGNLWITWREDQLVSLKPLISCWIDVICASILSMSDTEKERKGFLLVLDEMDSLEKLNFVVQALIKGRKHELCVIGGIQSLAQLDETYGKNEALTLRNSFSNNAVCQLASGDTYSAQEYSKIFGQHEVTRYQNSMSVGTSGGKGSRQLQKETESLIIPSQISGLDPLWFFFKFAQSKYVCKHKMPYVDRPHIAKGFILADNEWTRTESIE